MLTALLRVLSKSANRHDKTRDPLRPQGPWVSSLTVIDCQVVNTMQTMCVHGLQPLLATMMHAVPVQFLHFLLQKLL